MESTPPTPITSLQTHLDYERRVTQNPPARLRAYWSATAPSPYDGHGKNCFRGYIQRKGVRYEAEIRFGNCHSKGGYRICLKMLDYAWWDLKKDDKYEIFDLIVDNYQTEAWIFVSSCFDDDFGNIDPNPQGWYRFEIYDWFKKPTH